MYRPTFSPFLLFLYVNCSKWPIQNPYSDLPALKLMFLCFSCIWFNIGPSLPLLLPFYPPYNLAPTIIWPLVIATKACFFTTRLIVQMWVNPISSMHWTWSANNHRICYDVTGREGHCLSHRALSSPNSSMTTTIKCLCYLQGGPE